MARPAGGYRAADGTRLAGVTTIIKSLSDPGGLIHWAYQCGVDGVDYRRVRDSAADAGTCAHELIERAIRGTLDGFVPTTEIEQQAANALAHFETWRGQTKAEIAVHEEPLVSAVHGYGGTPDATATINGKRVLLDWKSSNGVYGEYLAQLGGYAILLEECEGWRPEEAHLLRFDKHCETWTQHYWGPAALELGRQAFLAALALYPFRAQLKKHV